MPSLPAPRSQHQARNGPATIHRGGVSGVSGAQGRHTIMLIQAQHDLGTRTYTDHDSMNDAVRSLRQVYEDGLRARNPAKREVEYTSEQLLGFVDGLYDITALSYDGHLRAYVPFDRKFIKEKLYALLSRGN